MARRVSYLAVEGQHDAAFIGRLLKLAGFSLVRALDDLDEAFERLVPRNFPFEGDLLRRVPVPFFHQTDAHAVAIGVAEGESALARRAITAIANLRGGVLTAVGFVLDADSGGSPADRLTRLTSQVGKSGVEPRFVLPSKTGDIETGPPRCGVFVMPDNSGPGTLEDLLLDCATQNYPDLAAKAGSFLDAIDFNQLSADDLKEYRAPAGAKKARTGAIGAILRPGKAIQTSIQDNHWLHGSSLSLPRIESFRRFLRDLLDEPDI